MLDDAAISGWCARSLGSPMTRPLFRGGHLAQVTGAELADGRHVVVKARPHEPRIAGCAAVQAHLAAAGFPCPVPLAGPSREGQYTVTAEAYLPGGTQLPRSHGAGPFAALLARLIALAPPVGGIATLAPPPPWAAWDHPGARLWPDRDDQGRDLNHTRGPAWVDTAAAQVRQRLRTCSGQARAGHGDWESQNIRWADGRPHAVHDWDSVIAQPEVAIAGLASAVWPATGHPGEAATIQQSAGFLAHYQAATGQHWDPQQTQHAWAAGLWVRLFNAKKDAAAGGGPQLGPLASQITERLARAGLPPAK
jgi:Ser/Thr protein kinase RdoA (MazF antagonist)